jgi:hypothetical protein
MKQQARFWHYHNGAVRLKINAGQTIHHSHGGATDEGYSWEAVAYSFDGETVTCEWATQSRDCDGRMDRNGVTHCPADQLAAGYRDDEFGVTYPAWQQGESGQRDYSAEAMGY